MDLRSLEKSVKINLMGKWKGVIVLLIIAALVTWGLLNLSKIMNAVQGKYTAWKTQRQIAALERPYKTDKIGGQTPEETFDMFIEALKKEDIELASKYFVLQKQDEWEKTLGEYKKNNLLANFVLELENTEKTWEKSKKNNENAIEFNSYIEVEKDSVIKFQNQEFPVESGSYLNVTRFEKYPMGVWKISVL
ncbi:MAG: hypothetical protein A3I92_00485 [Candidatus Yanofskybacteria bacterium RIFCSPLOWO2_02_FULL_43_10b]|uniref:Uncharacterized protein n=1 Tax=Candidatus Yanofskybacteria bacterium RIFCSPLOWO2_02_FULL_43_10b TaxID=1802704 RepID=A0A1F8H1J4_9BACT|nr:MAG: hypothetical protein A3I92_00485 [Candidatus Yanofskybacteria bacterium RIFCSPLOWO2_02_FULL_43_10b]